MLLLAFFIGAVLGAGIATLIWGCITIAREDQPEPRRARSKPQPRRPDPYPEP